MYIAKWYCLNLAVSSNKFLNKSINVTEKDFPILKELLNNLKRFNLLKHNH